MGEEVWDENSGQGTEVEKEEIMTDSERIWIEKHFDSLREEVTQLRIAVATQKVKIGMLSTVWGLLGGFLAVFLTMLKKG